MDKWHITEHLSEVASYVFGGKMTMTLEMSMGKHCGQLTYNLQEEWTHWMTGLFLCLLVYTSVGPELSCPGQQKTVE